MEINRFDENDVQGVIPLADVVDGRMVLLTTNTQTYDFGSRTDLVGSKVPATAEEAKAAKFIVTWAVSNSQGPFYSPTPKYDWTLRDGFGSTGNVPFSATVRLTYPGMQNGQTIPQYTPALAFSKGTYTVHDGDYIVADEIKVKGALLQVANTAEDDTVGVSEGNAGKLKVLAAMSDRCVGIVEYYDTVSKELTFRII